MAIIVVPVTNSDTTKLRMQCTYCADEFVICRRTNREVSRAVDAIELLHPCGKG